ncbi:N-acetylglucosamine-6-phosphate deacetylase [Longispora fulva]|uniref:N-acetylglucosamine-6-phosphate deacetylase n=2 Tax=Longispora fulva TaxID=619741 RepID=A0A8J7GWN0_9ACTN|nr:N-acetylglucosamine-6-phosphate deacetylase [Longispora fulva]GIG58648.1 N-acetylglucosamine-6-phosphate deacetylase [Longispora fulva]
MKIVTPDGVITGQLNSEDGMITEVVPGDDAHWLVPGFVDIHTHGGGGHTFTTGDPVAAREAAAFHLARGTTSIVASLVTSPPELMSTATANFRPLVGDGTLAGIHYEGPYLSAIRCGAQNPDFLRDPDLDELAALISLGGGAVRMVTIAPELPGALAATKMLVDAGIAVAIGHTDATYEQTLAMITAGATVGTHVFNGMRPPHHREPGPVFALLRAPGIVCEFVADGVHLHDGTLSFAAGVTGPERAALITDAMAAAGMPDGEYELGGQGVVVADGVARLTRNGSIAGSTLTMDAAFRRAVGAGFSIVDAARMAATTPAGAVGLLDRGAIEVGRRADYVILDDNLQVLEVYKGGARVA